MRILVEIRRDAGYLCATSIQIGAPTASRQPICLRTNRVDGLLTCEGLSSSNETCSSVAGWLSLGLIGEIHLPRTDATRQ